MLTNTLSSDPKSADYGNHYTQDQVISTFAPDDKTVTAVKTWLISAGIHESSISQIKNQGWIAFETTAGQLESLLNTKYNQYSHPTRKGVYLGTDNYKLPRSVADHVDFVYPGVAFAPQSKIERAIVKRPFWPINKSLVAGAAACSTAITPACLRSMYNFTTGSLSDPSNNLGIYEQVGEQYIQSDLNQFYAKYSSYVPRNTSPKNAPVDQQGQTQDSGEADLDYEMAVPIIYPQGTTNYEVGQTDSSLSFIDPLLEALDSSYCTDGGDCGKYKATNVISISYGDDEADYTAKYLNVRDIPSPPHIIPYN